MQRSTQFCSNTRLILELNQFSKNGCHMSIRLDQLPKTSSIFAFNLPISKNHFCSKNIRKKISCKISSYLWAQRLGRKIEQVLEIHCTNCFHVQYLLVEMKYRNTKKTILMFLKRIMASNLD